MSSFQKEHVARTVSTLGYLDNDTVVALGEDRGIVIDVRHVDVHGRRVDLGWTAVIRCLDRERVT